MSTVLILPGELTIYSVGELYPHWLDWLHGPGNEVVDASQVGEADAAGLQLLLSLQRALQGSDRRMQLRDPSAALVAACTGLGLQGLVGDAA